MNPNEQLLAEVVAETLEQFTFLFVEPEGDTPAPTGSATYMEATIGFHGGGRRGTLRVAAPEVLCREMAGNILGLDETAVTEDVAMDAIKELANVLMGSVTARWLGVEVSCTLSPPTARLLSPDQMNALGASTGALCFRVDEHRLITVLAEEPQRGEG